jgi:hypothetical protein
VKFPRDLSGSELIKALSRLGYAAALAEVATARQVNRGVLWRSWFE